jgi:hypothetical protein
MNSIKEFLSRKGPGGVPFWGYGLMGAAVIGGVIYVNARGGFAALAGAGGTAPSATGTGSGGSGSGGDQPIPPGPSQPPGAGGPPPSPPQPPPTPDPPLIQGGGQQSSSSGSGVSGPPPSIPSPDIPVNFSAGALLFQKLGLPTMDFRPGGNYGPPLPRTRLEGHPGKQADDVLGPAAPRPTTSLEGHPGKQADDVLPAPAPVTQGYQLANPIPTTQTNVVQHTAPVNAQGKKRTSGGQLE